MSDDHMIGIIQGVIWGILLTQHVITPVGKALGAWLFKRWP